MSKQVQSFVHSHYSTDCPGAFDPFLEGYYSAVGRATGQVVVYSGRGRFKVFFEVWWTHLS